MPRKIRRRAERFGLATMAFLGIAVLGADVLGWLDRLASNGVIPKITLLMLSTVTIFLLLEVERFQSLDNIESSLADLDIQGMAHALRNEHYGGLVKVHRRFMEDIFRRYVRNAKQVTILNTWIPNLHVLRPELEAALNRRAEVRILLLHPKSMVTELREQALRERGVDELAEPVRSGIERCLAILESIHRQLPDRRRGKLRVRVFNSLPSVSVYRADDHYLVGVFLHGQLAIESPQFEIDGTDTLLGQQLRKELDTLWEIGRDVDPGNWARSIDTSM
jgi:fido (protein-threonine AMPylation protein)